MMDGWTAAEVAQCLSVMPRELLSSMGFLSMLDENTEKWVSVHPELAEAQEAFSIARQNWWPSDPRRNSVAAGGTVITTAATLAKNLALFGGETLPLCGRPSLYGGECRGVKHSNGTCTYGNSHTDV